MPDVSSPNLRCQGILLDSDSVKVWSVGLFRSVGSEQGLFDLYERSGSRKAALTAQAGSKGGARCAGQYKIHFDLAAILQFAF